MDRVLHSYKTKGKVIVLYDLMTFILLEKQIMGRGAENEYKQGLKNLCRCRITLNSAIQT
jgi:hypothetical protein